MMDWGGSLDQWTHPATFPAWVAVCSAAFFGLVFLLSLVRAERTVANGALAALTFAGLAVAASLGLRGPDQAPERVAAPSVAGLPALACIDDLAGETALAACEKVLFSAPDTVAAAVAYTAGRINRLVALSAAAANTSRIATPDEQALRNSIERDRYGLVAYVLATRDKCHPSACTAFSAMTDHKQVASNMDGLIYEGLVARYAPSWAANTNPLVDLTASQPIATSRPTDIDFPSAESIPPVSIMTEPASPRATPKPDAATSPASPPAATGGPYVPARTANAPKKRSPQKRAPAPAQADEGPVQLSPSASQ